MTSTTPPLASSRRLPRYRRAAVVGATLLLASLFAFNASGATISMQWRARLGPAGVNGIAVLRTYSTGTGALILSLRRFHPSTTLPVALRHGNCTNLGPRFLRLPSVRSTTSGTVRATLRLTSSQVSLVKRVAAGGRFSVRVGIGSAAHCGMFARLAVPLPTTEATPTPRPTPTPTPRPTPTPTPSASCTPTDQDKYVYNPSRLKVLLPCLYVTGKVDSVTSEPDGDLHIRLKPDAAYVQYLNSANYTYQIGDLVVEPICVTAGDYICTTDPDPLTVLPTAGMHVWMEGRYVLDLQHNSWAELHPLYRWGKLP